MILTDIQIRAACEAGEIVIDPFEEKQVQGGSYDFRVGAQGASTSKKKLVNVREDGFLLLAPGDFAEITVLEELHLDSQHVARFGSRSKHARKGLIATTGPQIDPGYHGRPILGLTNLTPRPIPLSYKDDFVTLEFHKLDQPSTKPYSGLYQGKLDLEPKDIEMIIEAEAMSLSEVLTTLASLSTNVGKLADDIRTLTSDVRALKWFVPLLIAIMAIGISVIVSLN